MPTTPIENEILGFEVEADASAATKSIEKFMRGMSKAIRQNAGEYKKLTGDVTRYDRVLASLHKKAIAADMADLKNIKEKIKRVEDLRSVDI